MDVVGIDVGGAYLKYACTGDGPGNRAISSPFPMWRRPQQLAANLIDDLSRLFRDFPTRSMAPPAVAVTMTGELADCFDDRASGVDHIVRQVCQAAASIGILEIAFYGVDGRFRDAACAVRDVDLVASANWHALASLVGRRISRQATVIDIGSTTTDIIPIADGKVATSATTDHDRLCEGSLVYVGCRRTPVCALVDQLRFRGRSVSVMNEVFATIDDARLVLGCIAEDDGDGDTADGKPRTAAHAASRLARMIGLDGHKLTAGEVAQLGRQVVSAARQRIAAALESMPHQSPLVICGHGRDLIEEPDHASLIHLSERFGEAIARCAPSFAVASLYHDQRVSTG